MKDAAATAYKILRYGMFHAHVGHIPTACAKTSVYIQAPLNLRTLWRYINQFLAFNI